MKRSLCNFSQRISSHTERSLPLWSASQCLFSQRNFHSTPRWQVLKPFILADIGEGIREVQIIQWFVQPGARVEQFDKICEVASDKAIVEITSRFDGVIKKLHYEADAMAQVGKPLCDIDIQGDIDPADEKLTTTSTDTPKAVESGSEQVPPPKEVIEKQADPVERGQANGSRKAAHLATPAVRGLLREHNLDITRIQGTGRDGRVSKDDIHYHLNNQVSMQSKGMARQEQEVSPPVPPTPMSASSQAETTVSMTPIQAAMFKAMTRSLSIPHFLYSDEVDMTELSHLRTAINTSLSSQQRQQQQISSTRNDSPFQPSPQPAIAKLSYLPFIIKAVSQALHKYPILNATLSTTTSTSTSPATSTSTPPKLQHRPSHNIGIAIDTPHGLLVPVIKNVQSLSILEIAHHLQYLQNLASTNKLTSHPELLSGGTLTVSNIGNIGGGVLAPVLVEGQSAILGIGKARELPRFVNTVGGGGGGGGIGSGNEVERRLIAMFNWTADHRVLDGATVAKFAEEVSRNVSLPGGMVVGLR